MSLTVDDYVELLAGRNNRGNYSRDYVYIKTKDKPSKAKILLADKVGLPTNLNETYDLSLEDQKTKRKQSPKKKRKITPSTLRQLLDEIN